MEEREDQMMKPRRLQKGQLAFSKYTGASRPPNPSMAKSGVLSDARRGGSVRDRAKKFPQGVGSLYLAIVNRAILDVLENGENSRAAERWLLSRDFDRAVRLTHPAENDLEIEQRNPTAPRNTSLALIRPKREVPPILAERAFPDTFITCGRGVLRRAALEIDKQAGATSL